MRNVIESLRWANATQHSAQHAQAWLNDKDYPKERGFSLDPPVATVWKKFGYFSARGSHSLSSARAFSALAKSGTESLLGELQKNGVEAHLRTMNQITANFFLWITSPMGEFGEIFEHNLLQGDIQRLFIEIDQMLRIKQLPNQPIA